MIQILEDRREEDKSEQELDELEKFIINNKVNIDLSTIFVIDIQRSTVHRRSTAVLKILSYTKLPWSMLYAAKIIPVCIRDPIYKFVARNRYKWFGKRDECTSGS